MIYLQCMTYVTVTQSVVSAVILAILRDPVVAENVQNFDNIEGQLTCLHLREPEVVFFEEI